VGGTNEPAPAGLSFPMALECRRILWDEMEMPREKEKGKLDFLASKENEFAA
jgi:hypothetical protein